MLDRNHHLVFGSSLTQHIGFLCYHEPIIGVKVNGVVCTMELSVTTI